MSDDDLRAEIVALRNRLAELEGRLEQEPPDAERRVSRRGLLAAGIAGAAGLVATQVTTAAPAAAAVGDPIRLGQTNDGGTAITVVQASTGLNSSPFAVVNPNPNNNSTGIYGQLGAQSGQFSSQAQYRGGVVGEAQDNSGVVGLSRYLHGVSGRSETGSGVRGTSQSNHGVTGATDSSTSAGVNGTNFNGTGVLGESYDTNGGTGVRGTSTTGPGVSGEGTSGNGVTATSKSAYGVYAQGGLAPLRLKPSTKAGAPTSGSHLPGEFYVDQQSVLWFCTKAGTPGTWKKVTLT